MQPDQSTSPTIEVLPNQDELKRAIEAITGDSSKAVFEECLRSELAANHPSLSEICDESEQAIQIEEAIENDLLKRGPKENMIQLGCETKGVSETRIL